MKAVILAGGYAKRLWPLTKDTPKPLLQVGTKTVIGRVMERLEAHDQISEIVISTNAKFEDKFRAFIRSFGGLKPIKLVVEPTVGESGKLGSIGGLRYLIDQAQLHEDVLIVGGDNIFEVSFNAFISDFEKRGKTVIALKRFEDRELARQYGVCELDESGRIIRFEEKPDQLFSDLVSTALYCFTKADLHLVKQYLDEGNSPDAMGFFVKWLIAKSEVYGHVFDELWIDIGSKQALAEARKTYRGR